MEMFENKEEDARYCGVQVFKKSLNYILNQAK